MKISKFSTFFLPLTLSLCILYICYPGFMSYDSVRMLEEARSNVRGGIFPPTPVYILRIFDITGDGVTIMIFVQNFLTLFSLTLILRIVGTSLIASIIALVTFVVMPSIIGCMLVLWKDVTMVALVMLSSSIIFWASHASEEYSFYQKAKWFSLLLLIIGTLVRFNAITSTLILAIYWLSVFYRNQSFRIRGMAFILIIISMMVSNKIINEYSFPHFKKLESVNMFNGLMANDLLGISGWSRVSLIPFDSVNSTPVPKALISDIDNIYSSLGSAVIHDNNVRFGNHVKIYPMKFKGEDITRAWLNAVSNYPMAYINYRLDLFSEVIGAKSHETYEPTHFSRIDENKFGMKFEDRYITEVVLDYIKWASGVYFGKPWFVFLLSAFSVLFIAKSVYICNESKKFSYYSFIAAFLYITPFLFVTYSGEVRYSFPAMVLSSIPIFVFVFAHDQLLLTRIQNILSSPLYKYGLVRKKHIS